MNRSFQLCSSCLGYFGIFIVDCGCFFFFFWGDIERNYLTFDPRSDGCIQTLLRTNSTRWGSKRLSWLCVVATIPLYRFVWKRGTPKCNGLSPRSRVPAKLRFLGYIVYHMFRHTNVIVFSVFPPLSHELLVHTALLAAYNPYIHPNKWPHPCKAMLSEKASQSIIISGWMMMNGRGCFPIVLVP